MTEVRATSNGYISLVVNTVIKFHYKLIVQKVTWEFLSLSIWPQITRSVSITDFKLTSISLSVNSRISRTLLWTFWLIHALMSQFTNTPKILFVGSLFVVPCLIFFPLSLLLFALSVIMTLCIAKCFCLLATYPLPVSAWLYDIYFMLVTC